MPWDTPHSGRTGKAGLSPQVQSGWGDGLCLGGDWQHLWLLAVTGTRSRSPATDGPDWVSQARSWNVERSFVFWFFPYVTFLIRESCGRRVRFQWRVLSVTVLCAGSWPPPESVSAGVK